MSWKVTVAAKVAKRLHTFPQKVRRGYAVLIRGIERQGPVRGNWANYGKLGHNRHHCHLKKGKPTYVAVWEVKDDETQLVEVTYVGTHEKAPY